MQSIHDGKCVCTPDVQHTYVLHTPIPLHMQVAENSHQMLLINDDIAKQKAQAWVDTLLKKGGTGGERGMQRSKL